MRYVYLLLVLLGVLVVSGRMGLLIESINSPMEALWAAPKASASSLPSKIRLATFNIQHGRTPEGQVDLLPIAQFVMRNEIDLLFLNEVDAYWARSGHVDQTAQLAHLTGMSGHFHAPTFRLAPLRGEKAPAYGNALLSNVPWDKVEARPLPRMGVLEPRNLVVAHFALPLDGKDLLILGTHLSTDRTERAAQVEYLANEFDPTKGPMLLVGDLNSVPENADLQLLLEAGWFDVWELLQGSDESSGKTYPSDDPRYRIDYILASPDLIPALSAIEVAPVLISDHLPILVDLDLSKLH